MSVCCLSVASITLVVKEKSKQILGSSRKIQKWPSLVIRDWNCFFLCQKRVKNSDRERVICSWVISFINLH